MRNSIRIRDLTIDPPLVLAPMAGLTHSALRRIISGFGGAGLLSTEMLSARRLPTDSPTASPYLIRTPSERPLSYQLLTSEAKEIGPAIDALHRLEADAIDINMGCPARSVGRFGAGVRLMEEPENVRRVVAEARKRTALPLTAKIRIGTGPDERKLRDFCALLEDGGIDMIAIHARLKHESFARQPRWGSISTVKKGIRIPVIANGGVLSVRDAKRCIAETEADGLMLGRGAAIMPWLFAHIARDVFGRPLPAPVVSLPQVYYGFIGNLELFRPQYRLGRLKEFTHYFARNYQFGHHLAVAVQSSESLEEARERADRFFEKAR